MIDPHHCDEYEDTGEIASALAHIAYAAWRGPDFDPPEENDA